MAASDSSEQLHQLRSQLDALEQERKARAASAEAALAAAPDPASPDTESALNIPAVFSSFKSTDQAWFCLPISTTVISQTWKKKEI